MVVVAVPAVAAATRLYSDALRAISWTALVTDRRYSGEPEIIQLLYEE